MDYTLPRVRKRKGILLRIDGAGGIELYATAFRNILWASSVGHRRDVFDHIGKDYADTLHVG